MKQDLTFHAKETLCMHEKSNPVFYERNKKKKTHINLSSAEFAQRVVKVKLGKHLSWINSF